jgi:hypothetical protein
VLARQGGIVSSPAIGDGEILPCTEVLVSVIVLAVTAEVADAPVVVPAREEAVALSSVVKCARGDAAKRRSQMTCTVTSGNGSPARSSTATMLLRQPIAICMVGRCHASRTEPGLPHGALGHVPPLAMGTTSKWKWPSGFCNTH